MKNTLRQFSDDRDGAYSIVLALAALPLLGIAGLALDVAKSDTSQATLQAGADAAVIAGAASFRDADREQLVRTVFEEMVDETEVTVNGVEIAFDDDSGTVEVNATASTSTILSRVLGYDDLQLTAAAKSSFGLGQAQMDLVMCIDATGSMGRTIAAAKDNALSLEQRLLDELEARQIPIEALRARIVFFRDYDPPDWPTPMIESPFYSLPDQRSDMHGFIASERARGGANWPEAGLECFHEAMTSDWNRPDDPYTVLLPVIAIWTDAPSDHVGNMANIVRGRGHYPGDMPKTRNGLLGKWNDDTFIPQELKTVVLFGPETGGWTFLRTFPGYVHGGSVTDGNEDFVGTLADAIADNVTDMPARLIN